VAAPGRRITRPSSRNWTAGRPWVCEERHGPTPIHLEPGRETWQRRGYWGSRPGRQGPCTLFTFLLSRRGAVAARRAHNPKVAGSNPAAATNVERGRVRSVLALIFNLCSRSFLENIKREATRSPFATAGYWSRRVGPVAGPWCCSCCAVADGDVDWLTCRDCSLPMIWLT
jgi:hypothetical protein